MCMIEALHNFTCETGTCDTSHVYLEHVISHMHVKFDL
jgi:hypothetical protein